MSSLNNELEINRNTANRSGSSTSAPNICSSAPNSSQSITPAHKANSDKVLPSSVVRPCSTVIRPASIVAAGASGATLAEIRTKNLSGCVFESFNVNT